MVTVNWNGQEKEFTNIMEAGSFQRQLRIDGYGSDLWVNGSLIRSQYKDMKSGSWIVETSKVTFEII